MRNKANLGQVAEMLTYFGKDVSYPLSQVNKTKLYDVLMFEILFDLSKFRRQSITSILVIDHLLKQYLLLVEVGVTKLQDIKVEIPSEFLDRGISWRYSGCQGSAEMFGVENLGIMICKKMEQRFAVMSQEKFRTTKTLWQKNTKKKVHEIILEARIL